MKEDKNFIIATLKRITDIRADLVREYPFFGRLLLHLTPAVADCGTACTDMKHIIFDPVFISRLSDDELKFIMLHEVMHCVLKHCIRGKTLNNFLYNVACDIVVNSLIYESMGITQIIIDGEEPMHIAPDGKEGREYTADDIYKMLNNAEKNNNRYDEKLSFPGPEGKNLAMNTTDSHEIWKDISVNESGKLADVWECRIKKASKSCGSDSGIPSEIKRYLGETDYMPKTNWRQVLAEFIVHNRADYTFSKRDTRFSGDIIMPSFVENLYGDSVANLWFCVDSSGSINDEILTIIFKEILSACHQLDEIEGKIAFFDTEMPDFVSFDSEEDIKNIQPTGGGGTSFHCIFERLKTSKANEKPVGIIILTDGYAAIPNENEAENIPVLWIIIDSDINPEWGTVVHIGG